MMPLIILTVGTLVVLLLIFVAFSGPSTGKELSRRLSSAKDRHAASATASIEAQMRKAISARQASKMDNVASQFLPRPALLKQRISRTGKNWTLGHYGIASVAIGLVAAMLGVLQGAPWALSILLGVLVGLAIPHMVISSLIKKRIATFTTRFPDAIELLVRGLRAGLPISETLGVVAKEIPGAVGEEFSTVADKMRIGRTMEAALQDVADRLNTPEFQFFVITLAIQRETGGNLAETLSNLSDVLRKRAQMKLKIKAMSSESKASAYIVGSLPFLVFALIYVQSPDYMGQFFIDQRLIIAGLGGLTWMSIGAAIMAKMVNFEI
jgi:tight adherence protein B